jgi:hypothetical protein
MRGLCYSAVVTTKVTLSHCLRFCKDVTKLSQLKQAAGYVEALQRLRRFRQGYGAADSPPRRAVLELDAHQRPEPVTLSASTRDALNRALDVEEQTLLHMLRSLGVVIDADLPL